MICSRPRNLGALATHAAFHRPCRFYWDPDGKPEHDGSQSTGYNDGQYTEWGRAPPPISRLAALHKWKGGARRFRTGWQLRRWDANSSPSGRRIEQLNVRGRPVGQFWRRGVLAESMIRELYSTAVMAVSAENKELILDQILPTMWKMRHQHEEENAKGIAPADDILHLPTLFLRSKH